MEVLARPCTITVHKIKSNNDKEQNDIAHTLPRFERVATATPFFPFAFFSWHPKRVSKRELESQPLGLPFPQKSHDHFSFLSDTDSLAFASV